MTAGPTVSVSGCHVQYWPCSLLFRAVPRIKMVLRLFQRHLGQRFPTFPSLTSPPSLQINTKMGPQTKFYVNHRMHNEKKQKCLITAVRELTFCSLQYYVPCLQRYNTICIYSRRLLRSTSESYNMVRLCFVLNRLCHGTDGYLPDSHCGDSGSIPGQCMLGS